MKSYIHAVRSPVRRLGADDYLLITLLSFALSVSLTRLFLWLTGYPQLGGGTLHVAHLLWGGLLLFIAALLPLIFANRWVYQVVAVLAGAGVGLFIDEVGKFITSSNDYFYQPAAPIIYAFFLLCVLVYLRINQPPPRRARTELYAALEAIQEVLDRDLDVRERTELEARLRYIADQKEDPQLARLSEELLHFLTSNWVSIAPTPSSRLLRLREKLRATEEHWLTRQRARVILAIGLGVLGIASAVNFFRLILYNLQPGPFGRSLVFRMEAGVGLGYAYIYWYFMLGVFHGITSLLFIASTTMLVSRRESIALGLSFYALLAHLTILDLLMFYYFQFDTILFAILQFGLVLAVFYYRKRYLENEYSQGSKF